MIQDQELNSDDSDGITKRKKKAPGVYSLFYTQNQKLEKDIDFDVKPIVGNNGNRALYNQNGFKIEWRCDNVSGSHKDSGLIRFMYGNPLESVARMNVKRKYSAHHISVYYPRFASIVEENKEMPRLLYNFLKSLFK